MYLLAGGDGGGCRWGGVRGGRSRRSDLGFYSVFRCGRREGGAEDGWGVLVRLGNLQLALHEALDLVRHMDLLDDLALHHFDRPPNRAACAPAWGTPLSPPPAAPRWRSIRFRSCRCRT